MIRFKPFILIGIAALASGPSAAFALTTYPGHACLTRSDLMVRTGSEYENSDSADEHSVACPIAFEFDPLQPVLQDAAVVVIDDNPNVDLTCTLASRTSSGVVIDDDQVNTTGSDSNTQYLDFADLALVPGGHLTLYCNVPREWSNRRSSIVSYSTP